MARLLHGSRFGCLLALTVASAASLQAQLYSENFDDGVANNWVVASGTWQVSTGTDKTYDSTTSNAGPEIAYYNGATWATDYTYTARVRLWGTGYGNQVGVVYYYKDASNYYELELGGALDPNGKNVHLTEVVGGSSTTVHGNFTSPGSGNYVTVAIVRSGTLTTIKVEGVTVLTRTQAGLTGGGRIGVVDRFAGGKFNDITVTDSAAPSVSITAPSDNSTQSGTIGISATATDNVGVVGVQFKLDGANLGGEDTSPAYGITWDTTTTSNAQHVLTAVARDAAGNSTESDGILVNVSNGSLPTPWLTQDIGGVGAPGSADYSSGTFTVSGAGVGPWFTADEFRFVYQQMVGDCSITAHVVSVENVGQQWAHGGVMMRESVTNAGSKYAGLYETPASPGRGIIYEERATTGGTATGPFAYSGAITPYWLRLVRVGDTFTSYRSSNGTSWVAVGTPRTIAMASTIYVGLAVSSEVDGTAGEAVFDNVSVTGGQVSSYKSTFPRLGGAFVGSKDYNNPTYQAFIAKLDLAVLGFYKGWHGVSGYPSMTIRECVQDIKALNSNIKLGCYTLFESKQYEDAAFQDVWTKLNSETGPTGNGGTWTPNDWWGRTETGAQVTKEDPYLKVVNCTAFVTPDANGQRFPEWFAAWCSTELFDPVPEFDFWFMDNFFWRPRNSIDWDRDGHNDSKDDPAVRTYFRAGNVAAVNAIAQEQPGLVVMGNVDGFIGSSGGHLMETQYHQLIGASLFESAMGRDWSEEAQVGGGWYNMMAGYRSQMANTKAPHLVMLTIQTTTTGKCAFAGLQGNYGGGSNYAFMRYALASVLMDDGYVAFHAGGYSSTNTVWFDEFDLAGTAPAGTSWLGAAIDPPQTGAYQNGVFRRRFENGMAIVNPRTNPDKSVRTAQTITPEAGYKRFVGTQDPTTNNGANVTSITIQPGDGILLIKQ